MRLRKDDHRMGNSPRKHSREFKIEAVKQVVEARLACNILNRMAELGMPVSCAVGM
ncbi:MAG: transposase-like protein [Hyphomicrobiaceae bacterium]|jgi:transposase-like protein